MKDVVRRRYVSGRCLTAFDPEISEWGNLRAVMCTRDTEHSDRAYSGKWNISVPEGKENKSYSASSGERKQRSPNQCTTLYLIVHVFFREPRKWKCTKADCSRWQCYRGSSILAGRRLGYKRMCSTGSPWVHWELHTYPSPNILNPVSQILVRSSDYSLDLLSKKYMNNVYNELNTKWCTGVVR